MILRMLVKQFGTKILQQQMPDGSWVDVPVVIDEYWNVDSSAG